MQTATISDLTRDDGWAPIRARLGAAAFGVNAWTKDAGEDVIAEHAEERTGHEELYVVLGGRATFIVDSEEQDAPVGTVVVVQPSSRRRAVAVDDHTTILVVGGRPGGVFKPRAWETNAVVFPLFAEGRIEEARGILRAAPADYEDGESIEYNLACCEARLGNAEGAFAHLERSLQGRDDLIELARGDEDLASLRDDPRFAELVGVPATQPG